MRVNPGFLPQSVHGLQYVVPTKLKGAFMLETRFDVVIRGGTVVSGQGSTMADIAVSNGRIEMIARDLTKVSAARVIDATGKLILPGIIDAHTHPVYDDDLMAVSISGVYGGVTTVMGFVGPNPAWGLPATNLIETSKKFIDEGETQSVTDFALHGVMIGHDDVVPQVPDLVKMGIISIKFFMMYKKRGMMLSDDQILRVMDALAANGAIAMVHAENGPAIDYLTDKLSAAPPVKNDAYLKAHRDLLEAEAIFCAVALAESVGCPL
jgi:dihydropyrimidinase